MTNSYTEIPHIMYRDGKNTVTSNIYFIRHNEFWFMRTDKEEFSSIFGRLDDRAKFLIRSLEDRLYYDPNPF